MTVKEVVMENKGAKYVKIMNNDYRHCNLIYNGFVNRYKGTDVWHEHVACYSISVNKPVPVLEIWL